MNKKQIKTAEEYLDTLAKQADSCCNNSKQIDLYNVRISHYYGAVTMLEKLGYCAYVNSEHCHKINKFC